MPLKYLINGATGGIGGGVLEYFQSISLPNHLYAAASSNASKAEQFTSCGMLFRHADYNDPETLERAFSGVEHLLFVSSNTFDNELRGRQHRNVIKAAKKVGVEHVWYTSLAFGGYGNDSKASVMAAHLVTEGLLRESGLSYTSIREGFYADAFPIFTNWYPDTTEVYVPADGPMPFTSRDELAEATAKIMLKADDVAKSGTGPAGKTWKEKQLVLLTAAHTCTCREIVDIINQTTGREVGFKIVPAGEFVDRVAAADKERGGKPRGFWESQVSWFEGISRDGDGKTVSAEMEEVLGRRPKDGAEVIRELLEEDRDYKWHQNYIGRNQGKGSRE